MKKLLLVLVCLSLIFGLQGMAMAGSYDREDTAFGYTESRYCNADHVLVSKPCYVKSITIYASSANALAVIYDSADSSPADSEVRYEIGEASQYESKREVFNPPIIFNNGVYADVTNGNIGVEYR